MSSTRRIVDRKDLAEIHKLGVGFVLYPFGRKIHSARCTTVPDMALNPAEPRQFSPDAAAARKYQVDRLSQFPTARPFERVRCCSSLVPDDVLVGAGKVVPSSFPPKEAVSSKASPASGEGQHWACRSGPNSFELWTTRRTPFATDQSAQQKTMIREIGPHVASLRCQQGERLHGVFISEDAAPIQPDAENIAFYNFGSAPFAGCGPTIAFERSYAKAPAPPRALDGLARFYHRWSVAPEEARLDQWLEGDVVAAWVEVPLELEGDLGLAVWRALREHPERVTVLAALSASEPYGINVTIAVPPRRAISMVNAMKGLVDGSIAGLQRADTLDPRIVAKLLARSWGRAMDETTLLRLVSANTPPTLLPRSPFNRNGLDPCDELCVAGIARSVTGGQGLLTGKVFRVKAR